MMNQLLHLINFVRSCEGHMEEGVKEGCIGNTVNICV